nr:ABC transporter substrate-binding protein [Methanococcoides sp.]
MYYMDSAELIRILDAKNKVVGVTNGITQNENQFPELSKRSFVGKVCPGEPDYEAILELHADVLLTFYYNEAETEKMREKLPGVAVIFSGIYYPDLSDPEGSRFTDGVRKLGYILDRENEAEEYVKWRIGWIDEIKSRTEGLSEDEKPRVFAGGRLKPESSTYRAYTKIDTFTQMCTMAGGKNIAEDLPEFVQHGMYYVTLDPEWVVEQDPEFIFAHDARTPYGYDMDDLTTMKEESDAFMNRPELVNVAAVKTGNVYILNGIFRNDVSGGVIGAVYMAKILHPDLFEDLDPETIHQEYLTMQHFDYDLDEHGTFVYPPIEVNGGLAGIPDRYRDGT